MPCSNHASVRLKMATLRRVVSRWQIVAVALNGVVGSGVYLLPAAAAILAQTAIALPLALSGTFEGLATLSVDRPNGHLPRHQRLHSRPAAPLRHRGLVPNPGRRGDPGRRDVDRCRLYPRCCAIALFARKPIHASAMSDTAQVTTPIRIPGGTKRS